MPIWLIIRMVAGARSRSPGIEGILMPGNLALPSDE